MHKYKNFRPRIRSRHPSHTPLREKVLPLFPFRSVIRFGSSTEMTSAVSNGGDRIEINTTAAISNSSNKLLMKQCFKEHDVKTAIWVKGDKDTIKNLSDYFDDGIIKFPIIAKHIYGSKGKGNYKIEDYDALKKFINKRSLDINHFIFEKFYNYSREYRLHVTGDGCFYTCRKMLKSETPSNRRWYRNDDNSVWILEENDSFDKPVNWDIVIDESVKALNSVGLDIGAVDLRIQSATTKKGKKRDNPDFIVVEINSAPSFGKLTLKKYIEELPKVLLKKKHNEESISR